MSSPLTGPEHHHRQPPTPIKATRPRDQVSLWTWPTEPKEQSGA
ncbi:hypothetical protein ACWDBD_42025 [Streptomyces sp. NPDC001118]